MNDEEILFLLTGTDDWLTALYELIKKEMPANAGTLTCGKGTK